MEPKSLLSRTNPSGISSGTRRATSTSGISVCQVFSVVEQSFTISLGSSPRMSRRTSIYQIMEKDQTLKFGAIGRGSTSCGSLVKAS